MYNPASGLLFISNGLRSIGYLLISIFLLLQELDAQSEFNYEIFVDATFDKNQIKHIQDSFKLQTKIMQWISEQRKNGYLLAGLDSIVKTNLLRVYLYKGMQFKYLLVQRDLNDNNRLLPASVDKGKQATVNPEDWILLFEKWIYEQSRRGHPFARIDLHAIRQWSDTLLASVELDQGPQILFRRSEQRNKVVLKEFVLNRLTGIYPGNLYDQFLVEDIPVKFRKLSFLGVKSSPRVLFLGMEGSTWLYLDRLPSNRFDILLGLSSETGLSTKKYRLTGEAGFDIINSLKTGERFYMKYENLIENSPRLKLGIDFPYIKLIPFGIATEFNLYKHAEEYLDLNTQLSASYSWALGNISALLFNYFSSSVLNPDTVALIRTGRLPDQLDYILLTAGIRHEYSSLDYPVSPTRGFQLTVDVKAGSKSYKASNLLLNYESDRFHIQNQYDSLNKNKEQALFSVNTTFYYPLAQRHIIKTSLLANGILSAGKILDNEFIRVGGYKNLRGFDEDFYKCTNSIIQTLEYRFLLDRDGFINVFSDFAVLRQKENNVFKWNWYEGIGIGIQIQSKVGVFSLQYALGANKFQSINLSNGKIHFGYSSRF